MKNFAEWAKNLSLNFEKAKFMSGSSIFFSAHAHLHTGLTSDSNNQMNLYYRPSQGSFPFCESGREQTSIEWFEDLTRYGVTQAATQQLMSLGGNRVDCGKATRTRRRKTVFHFPL